MSSRALLLRISCKAGSQLLPGGHIARRAAGAFEPCLQLRDAHVVESGVADLDANRSCLERGLPAPFGAPELLQGHRASFVQALGGDLGDVLDTLAVAEGD